MKKILAFLLTLTLFVCCAVSALAAYDINTAKNSVVRIVTYFTITDESYPELLGRQSYVAGSGFAIGVPGEKIGYVATAGHVTMHNVESSNVNEETLGMEYNGQYVYVKVHVDEIRVLVTDISGFILANIENYSPRADVAVLKLNNDTLPRQAAVLYDRKEFDIGEQMTAMGFPVASENNLAVEVSDQLIATSDKVSTNTGNFTNWDGHSSTRYGDQITTTAEMSPGISGGPLVDKDGYVIGVCVSGSSSRQNVNYAVAADELLKLMGSITELKYVVAPLPKEGLSTTAIIIIVAGVVIIALLVALLIAGTQGKKNKRTLVMTGSMAGKSIQLKKGTPVVIGRDPKRCQIIYPKDAAGVSSVHCTITFDGKAVTVADNGSSYGTFVGGTKVEPGKPMIMHRGQEVTFGSDKNSAELH